MFRMGSHPGSNLTNKINVYWLTGLSRWNLSNMFNNVWAFCIVYTVSRNYKCNCCCRMSNCGSEGTIQQVLYKQKKAQVNILVLLGTIRFSAG